MTNGSAKSGPEPKSKGYAVLFVTLLFYFGANPLATDGGFFDIFLNLMIIGALLSSLRRVSQDWKIVAIAALLGVGALGARPLLLLGIPPTPALIVTTVSMIAFFLVVSVPLLLDVYLDTSVTFRTILGACSMFLVLGFTWFGIFTLIEIVVPESFAFGAMHPSDIEELDLSSHHGETVLKQNQLFYFSFVTITTLGFGDVLPVSTIARTYTTLGAVIGQLFLATMIARLVGIHSANSKRLRDLDSSG
jgi:hypothetical protein